MKIKKDKLKEPVVVAEQLQNPSSQHQIPEVAGRGGLDPCRFGDWEIAGKCVDF